MAVGALSAHDVPLQAATRVQSRRRAVRRFKLSLLLPLMALFLFLLTPVLLLQLYFSFHQWTVYLGSWWDADFVGLDLFQEVLTDPRFGWAVVRSLAFATGSTLGCFVFGFLLAYLMYRPFRGQAVYYIIFILPMLTVPVVVAYTAEMMLYQSGPDQRPHLRHRRRRFQAGLADRSEHRAGDRRLAGNLELDAVLIHHFTGRPFGHSEGADRGRRNPRRLEMADLLGSATAAAAPGHPARAGAALSRGNGRIPQDLGAVPRRSRLGDGDAAGLHLHDDVAVLPDLQGRGHVLYRHGDDDRHRLDRNPSAAPRAIPLLLRRWYCWTPPLHEATEEGSTSIRLGR